MRSHVEDEGEAFFAEVDKLELEGIVAKKATSVYRLGRSPAWVKIKTKVGREREAKRMDYRNR